MYIFLKSKCVWLALCVLPFMTGCTGTTSVSVGYGVYGGYGYPHYGYWGGHYYPGHGHPTHPVKPKPVHPIVRPDRPTIQPIGRPIHRPSVGRPTTRPSFSRPSRPMRRR